MAKLNIEIDIQDAYDVEEAARILGISTPTVWRWIRKGKLSSFKVIIGTHSKTLILIKEVERLKEESSRARELSAA